QKVSAQVVVKSQTIMIVVGVVDLQRHQLRLRINLHHAAADQNSGRNSPVRKGFQHQVRAIEIPFDISTEDLAGCHFDTEPAKRTVTKGCTEQFAALQLTAGKLPGVKTGTPAVLQVITVTYGRQIRRLTGGLDGAGDLCSCGPAGFSILGTHLVPAD